jgi:hypothetical protein
MNRFGAIGFVLAIAIPGKPASSAETAYATWPSVVRLEKHGEEIVAVLGGMYAIEPPTPGGPFTESTPIPSHQALIRSRDNKWRLEEVPPLIADRHARVGLEHGVQLREEMNCEGAAFGLSGEFPSETVMREGYEWFGNSWYGGEGEIGAGGIGRRRAGDLRAEVRWPAELRGSSVEVVEWDGRWLWIGTAFNGEYGSYPSIGLARYDWKRSVFEHVTLAGYGPCGFMPHSLLRVGDELWVGSEMGLSIHREADGSWHHFVPDLADPRLMRPVTCEALYSEIPLGLATGQSDVDRQVRALALQSVLRQFRPEIGGGFGRKTPKRSHP